MARAVAGLDVARFEIDLRSHAIVEAFGADLERARAAGREGERRVPFPTFAVRGENGEERWAYDETDASALRALALAAGATPGPLPAAEAAVRRFGRLADRRGRRGLRPARPARAGGAVAPGRGVPPARRARAHGRAVGAGMMEPRAIAASETEALDGAVLAGRELDDPAADVHDAFCPRNARRFALDGSRAAGRRTSRSTSAHWPWPTWAGRRHRPGRRGPRRGRVPGADPRACGAARGPGARRPSAAQDDAARRRRAPGLAGHGADPRRARVAGGEERGGVGRARLGHERRRSRSPC